jgi:predicted DNA-binding transcriptional regulator YafY
VVINQDDLQIIRIQFIQTLSIHKTAYKPKDFERYQRFLDNLQNAMTLYGVTPKKALLLASPNIARYFKPQMKKFLKTQKFIRELDDGSIEFELSYTQELEILPFIQKWLPDIKIIKPVELNDALKKKIDAYQKVL